MYLVHHTIAAWLMLPKKYHVVTPVKQNHTYCNGQVDVLSKCPTYNIGWTTVGSNELPCSMLIQSLLSFTLSLLCHSQVYTANGFMMPQFAGTPIYPMTAATAGIRPVKVELPTSTVDWSVR